MKTEWQHVSGATIAVTLKFVLTEEAERARDKALVRYLLEAGEHFNGKPFAVNPIALADLWAQAWHEGRSSWSPRETTPPPPDAAPSAEFSANKT